MFENNTVELDTRRELSPEEKIEELKDAINDVARGRSDTNEFPFQRQITEAQRKKFATRLLTLANVIKALTPAQYNHDTWVLKYNPKNHCGSTACALGHAACNPELFKGLPFKVVMDDPTETNPRKQTFDLEVIESRVKAADPYIDEASDEYFGIGAMEAIFDPAAHDGLDPSDVTKNMAVKRIIKFVRDSYGYEYA